MKAPVWNPMLPERVSVFEKGWAGMEDDPEEGVIWLAFIEDRFVGVQGFWSADETDDNLHIPPRCAELGMAGTREGERGKGIGTLLTQHVFYHARSAGYHYCETDWRSTNLLSSRFWPHQGFNPVVYRLVRRIDQRIAWADGMVSH